MKNLSETFSLLKLSWFLLKTNENVGAFGFAERVWSFMKRKRNFD